MVSHATVSIPHQTATFGKAKLLEVTYKYNWWSRQEILITLIPALVYCLGFV